jgi:two-component system, OmpR family, phosphate regulon sensor histidine kinase PhoR
LTGRIFVKLVFAVLCVLAFSLTAVHFLATRTVEHAYTARLRSEIQGKARLLASIPPDILGPQIEKIAKSSDVRITLIDHSGKLIADSSPNLRVITDYTTHSEIRSALAGEQGWAEHVNEEGKVNTLYLALPYAGGALRVATPLSNATQQLDEIRRQLLLATALAIFPAALIALLFARYFSRKLGSIISYASQLAKGNFEARLPTPSHDELGILSAQLNETAAKLQGMFEELQREHTELERVERVRKDFVINVSHELRTPLASIQGYTETLLDGAIDDRHNNVRFLTIIRQNAERLGRLTSDLLTLSRIELKTQQFQFAAYYVNHLIREDVDTVRPMAEKKNVAIVLDPAPENTEVFCDAEAVHQILANLLDNALKYTPAGGQIFVGARPLPRRDSSPDLGPLRTQDYDLVELYVRDTGLGIPAEELPRLFERFYRVDKARSRELGGTGLGLAIVKHLVRAHGGEVGVISEANQGSRFYFTLPVHDVGLLEESRIQTELTTS